MNHKPPGWVGLLGIPQVYNNHHLWWGRSEIVIIYPDIYINTYTYIYILHTYIYIYTYYIRITHIGKWYMERIGVDFPCNVSIWQGSSWSTESPLLERLRPGKNVTGVTAVLHGGARQDGCVAYLTVIKMDGDEKMVIFLVNIPKANWKPRPSRNSGFTHWTWRLYIVMVAYQRVAS
jgi:hypothetical protein